ncbi:MAG TPA: O-methyltransferase [Candidatus Baltobacteraceae bacterium]|nr:O-methyltransferase [Candidatus Baltobacteraceae bacterium]
MRDLAYLTRLHREPPPLLLELEQHGIREGIPIVDRASGRFLSVLVHAMQANRILELGTAYGYSTLWMALALPPAGRIWTIDPDIERTEVAASYFARAGVEEKVIVINQRALEMLDTFQQRNLDIVFIDAVKTEYEQYLEMVVPMLKRSGIVVVDNLLWSGRAAASPGRGDDEDTKALRAFNKAFLNHPQLDATIVPIGDGIGLGARVD